MYGLGKIFANNATEKGLISKIYKQLKQLNNNKKQTTNQKTGRRPKYVSKKHVSKEETQMAKRHMKRCSTSILLREMQIKTTMRYHLTLVSTAIIKNSTNKNGGKNVEKRELYSVSYDKSYQKRI